MKITFISLENYINEQDESPEDLSPTEKELQKHIADQIAKRGEEKSEDEPFTPTSVADHAPSEQPPLVSPSGSKKVRAGAGKKMPGHAGPGVYDKEGELIIGGEDDINKIIKDKKLTPEEEKDLRDIYKAAIEGNMLPPAENMTPNKKLEDSSSVISPSGVEVDMDEVRGEMESAKKTIVSDSPLFGPYVNRFIPIYTWEIKTMATDGVRLFVNPEFAQNLSWLQKIFVILHEILHCVLLHIQRYKSNKSYKMDKFNVAADYEINALIVSDFTKHPYDGFDAAFAKELRAYHDDNFLNMPVEKIYELIPDPPEEEGGCSCGAGKPGEGKEGEGAGKGEGEGEGAGKGEGGGEGQCTCGGGTGTPGNIGGILDPKEGKEIAKRAGYGDDEMGPDKSLDDIKRDWKQAAIEINRRTKQGGGGDMGALRKKLAEITRSEINWKTILKKYSGDALSKDPEWRFGNRKYYHERHIVKTGLHNPKDALNKITVCVDTSGSVDDITMHRMLNEITQIIFSKKVNEIYVIFFDNSVVNAQKITAQKRTLEPFGGGGTNFQMPLDWIHKKLGDKVSLCLFMTDGYEKMPREPKRYGKGKKFIWMIYNNPDFKAPFGVKINMGDQKMKGHRKIEN